MATIEFEKDKNEAKVIFRETDLEAIPRMLCENMLDSKDVEFAAMRKKHPLDEFSEMEVKAKEPAKELISAVKETKKQVSEFSKEFASAWA